MSITEGRTAKIWVNAGLTILVTQHPDGSLSVALRAEPDAIWGPPIEMEREA